jgi:hypothetical protein
MSTSAGDTSSRYPSALVTITPAAPASSSSARRRTTASWAARRGFFGGAAPHIASASSRTGTVRPARSTRAASRTRCFGERTGTTRSATRISKGPSSPNASGTAGRPAALPSSPEPRSPHLPPGETRHQRTPHRRHRPAGRSRGVLQRVTSYRFHPRPRPLCRVAAEAAGQRREGLPGHAQRAGRDLLVRRARDMPVLPELAPCRPAWGPGRSGRWPSSSSPPQLAARRRVGLAGGGVPVSPPR